MAQKVSQSWKKEAMTDDCIHLGNKPDMATLIESMYPNQNLLPKLSCQQGLSE